MARLLLPYLYVLLLCMLVGQFPAVSGLFDWLRPTENPAAAAPPPPPPPPSPAETTPAAFAKDAPFEMATGDEKFLALAKQMELSPLDSCHYRVVSQIKVGCESLSEEQLAKLGVMLFNCQAEIEGRPTYPCTVEMGIQQCTTDMDSDTWNAYHIVSNRARSVCYSTRQQLFRRRAEHTVNTLISTASNQLAAMKDLKEGQLELRELTAASVDKLLEGHSALQNQQVKLQQGQGQMESSLTDNLERLGQEKALIASGQQQVADLIQDITNRMEVVNENLQIQGSEVQDSHRAIVQDLADVRHQAHDIYQKIDHGMLEFLQYQDQTSQYYADLMNKLERMNGTLGVTLHFLDNMQSRIEERLHMIQRYLGVAGLSLTAAWTCIAHTSYFLLLAVLQSFLRCTVFSRAMLLLIVPLNAVAEANHQPALDLASLSLLLVILSLAYFVFNRLWKCTEIGVKPAVPLSLAPCETVKPQKSASSGNFYPESSTPQKDEMEDVLNQDPYESGALGMSVVSPPQRKPFGTPSHSTPRLIPQPVFLTSLIDEVILRNHGGVADAVNDSLDFVNDSRSASPSPSVVTNRSLSGRHLCNAFTKTGKACKKRATFGQEYCRIHEGGSTSYIHS